MTALCKSYDNTADAERARVTGRRELKKLLMDAGLDDATAEADVDALHEGRILVLVHIAAIARDDARALLDGAVGAAAS